jgi:hypothetical protein
MRKKQAEGKIITVIPCSTPLTWVYLNFPSETKPFVRYAPIVAIMFREHDVYWLDPITEYSTDYERFSLHPGKHQTSADGPCECSRRGDRRCGVFGIMPRTPEELKADPALTDEINRRISHLIDVALKDEAQKQKAREKSHIYAQRSKEKRLAKAVADAEEYERLAPDRLAAAAAAAETKREQTAEQRRMQPIRVGVSNTSYENHSVCGKPLPRSIEELAFFQKAYGSAPEGDRWYCECGTAPASI